MVFDSFHYSGKAGFWVPRGWILGRSGGRWGSFWTLRGIFWVFLGLESRWQKNTEKSISKQETIYFRILIQQQICLSNFQESIGEKTNQQISFIIKIVFFSLIQHCNR